MTTDSIISKFWPCCHALRDDGVGYSTNIHHIIENIETGLANFRTVAATLAQSV